MIDVLIALAGVVVGWLLSRMLQPRAPATTPDECPPAPKKTAEEHATAIDLDAAELFDDVAEEHGVPADDVAELIDLADRRRTR